MMNWPSFSVFKYRLQVFICDSLLLNLDNFQVYFIRRKLDCEITFTFSQFFSCFQEGMCLQLLSQESVSHKRNLINE